MKTTTDERIKWRLSVVQGVYGDKVPFIDRDKLLRLLDDADELAELKAAAALSTAMAATAKMRTPGETDAEFRARLRDELDAPKELQTAWDEAEAGGELDLPALRQYVEEWLPIADQDGQCALPVVLRLLDELERLKEGDNKILKRAMIAELKLIRLWDGLRSARVSNARYSVGNVDVELEPLVWWSDVAALLGDEG